MACVSSDDDIIVDDNVMKINDSIVENASVIPAQRLERGLNVSLLSDYDKLQLSSWGLPEAILKRYACRGITSMFPWQVECLCSGQVLSGGNLVYSAPTSAGKTLVAEILTIKTVLEKKKKAIIILPFVAVVREKMVYFQELLSSSGIRVEGLMGGRSLPGGFKSVHIAVCTIEKANSLINRLLEEGNLKDVGIIVVDELHLLGDPFRGYLLELLLTKIRYMSLNDHSVNIQIVGMSATLPNLPLLAGWLDADLYKTDLRPVPLSEFYKCGSGIYNKEHQLLYDIKPQVAIKDDPEHVVYLCIETIFNGHSALVFCSTKVWCENLAQHLSTSLRSMVKHPRLGPTLREQLPPEGLREVTTQLNNLPVGSDRILLGVVCTGVAFHHAGLTMDERDVIESGFRAGRLRVLVATSTLSSGVNLPARRVIIRTPTFHGQPLDPQTYHQMVGRAGRTGRDTQGESFLVCKPHEQVTARNLVGAPLRPVRSCLAVGSSLSRAVLEVVASGVACSLHQVARYAGCTLYATEHSDLSDPVATCVDFLHRHELLRLDVSDTEETRYIATPLGQACLAASLGPEQGLELFHELQKARQCFVLESELHIIYQVTPFSVAQQLGNLDWMQVLSVWQGLSASERRVGELVGAEERLIVRAVRGTLNPRDLKQVGSVCVIRRFYTALALQELVQEVPLAQVALKFSCSRGMLQALQQAAATFAGMVSAFCRRLGWSSLELLVDQFQSRLEFGVQRELCDLMRLDLLNGQRARTLFNGGFTCVSELASAAPRDVEAVLRTGLPFQSSKERDGESAHDAARRNELRIVWVTGRPGMTEKEAAILLVREARELIQKELGCAVTSWDIEDNSLSENASECSTASPSCDSSHCPKLINKVVPSKEPNQPSQQPVEQPLTVTKSENSCLGQINSSDIKFGKQSTSSSVFGQEFKLECRGNLFKAKTEQIGNVETEIWTGDGPVKIENKKQTSAGSLQLKPSSLGGVETIIIETNANKCLTDIQNDKVSISTNITRETSCADALLNKQSTIDICEESSLSIKYAKCASCTPRIIRSHEQNNAISSRPPQPQPATNVPKDLDLPKSPISRVCQTPENGSNLSHHSIDMFSSPLEVANFTQLINDMQNVDSPIDVSPAQVATRQNNRETNTQHVCRPIGGENAFIEDKSLTAHDLSIILDSPAQDNAVHHVQLQTSNTSLFNLSLKSIVSSSKGYSFTQSDTDVFNSSELNVALQEETLKTFLDSNSQNKSQNLFDDSLVVDTQLGLALDHIKVTGYSRAHAGILAVTTPVSLCLKAEAAVFNKDSIRVVEKRNASSKVVEDWLAKKARVDSVTPPKTVDSGIDSGCCEGSKFIILSPHSPDDVIADTPPLPSLSLKQVIQHRDNTTSKSTTASIKNTAPTAVKLSKRLNPARSSFKRDEDVISNTPTLVSQSKSKRFNRSNFLDGLMDEVPRDNKKVSHKRKNISPNYKTKGTRIKDTSPTIQGSPCKKSKLASTTALKTQQAPKVCSPVLKNNKEDKENPQQKSQNNLSVGKDMCQEQPSSNDKICAKNILEPNPAFYSVLNHQTVPEKYTLQANCDNINPEAHCDNHNFQVKLDTQHPSQIHKTFEVDNIVTSSFLDLNFDTICDFDSKSQDTPKTASSDNIFIQTNYATLGTAKGKVDINNKIAVPTGNDCVIKTDLSVGPSIYPDRTSFRLMAQNCKSNKLAADLTRHKRKSPRLMEKNAITNGDQVSLKTANTDDAENDDIVINSQDETLSSGNRNRSERVSTRTLHSRLERMQDVDKRKAIKNCQLGIGLAKNSSSNKICSSKQDNSLLLALHVTHVCDAQDIAALATRLAGNKLPVALALSSKAKPATSSHSGTIGAKIIGHSTTREPLTELGLEGGGYILEGVALCLGDGELFYLSLKPTADLSIKTSILRQLMIGQQPLVIWHAKEAIERVAHCCSLTVSAPIRDPDVAAWLLQPEAPDSSLRELTSQYCGGVDHLQHTLASLVGNKPAQVKACAIASATWHLFRQLNVLLAENQLLTLYTDVEMPVVSILARLEMAGFGLDPLEAEKTLALLNQELTSLEKKAYQLAGHSFKISSHTQLHKVLYRELRLPGGKGNMATSSTCKEALSRLKKEHELPGVVQEWRKISAAINKCVLPFLQLSEAGRVFGQCVGRTSTGRVSMLEPNPQCLPRDFLTSAGARVSVRGMFVAPTGAVLVSADYCQLELRLLAHLARCPHLTTALNGPDVFTAMAAHWSKVPHDQVTDTLRQQAKQVCYGIIYGMGSRTLSQQLDVDEECATRMMQDFMTTYVAVKTFLEETVSECQTTGFVTTLAGRRRYLPDITSRNIQDRGHAERQAVNSRVQGSAADIVKRAMVSLDQDARMSRARLVLNLHDELMYEVPADRAHSVCQAVKEGMEGAVSLSVPLPVKVKLGTSWGSLNELNPIV